MNEIVIALPKMEAGRKIQEILAQHGLVVSLVCTSGAQVLGAVSAGGGSAIVITTPRLRDMHFSYMREYLPPICRMLLLGKASDLEQEATDGIVCLEMPVRSFELVNTVYMLLGAGLDSGQSRRRRKRTARDEQAIARAKQLLMERNHMTEQDAYRYMQKNSMDTGRSLAQTAKMILMLLYDQV